MDALKYSFLTAVLFAMILCWRLAVTHQTQPLSERQAYVHGAMEACEVMRVSVDVVAAVCRDLKITQEELLELGANHAKYHAVARLSDHLSEVR